MKAKLTGGDDQLGADAIQMMTHDEEFMHSWQLC